jgi:hypothetical protein
VALVIIEERLSTNLNQTQVIMSVFKFKICFKVYLNDSFKQELISDIINREVVVGLTVQLSCSI